MSETTPRREEFGLQRTECGCACCAAPCRHVPGGLVPSDLAGLCPPGQDVFAWAEQHLRALTAGPHPALVPARGVTGGCHWFFEGRCAVHGHAPFGCAFFDSHQPPEEVRRRQEAMARARAEDAAADGLYTRVWRHLRAKGLVAPPGDWAAVLAEVDRIRRGTVRRARRLGGR
jgi:hypothetical protein